MSLIKTLLLEALTDKDEIERRIIKNTVKLFKKKYFNLMQKPPSDDEIKQMGNYISHPRLLNDFVDKIIDSDPTNGKYMNWILSNYVYYRMDELSAMGLLPKNLRDVEIENNPNVTKGTLFTHVEEDLPKVKEYLELFDTYKHKIDDADINNYNNLNELFKVVKEFKYVQADDLDSIIEQLEEGEDYKHIHHPDSNYELYIPLTEKGACGLGINTEWCTAWGEYSTNPDYQSRTSYFDEYGELYIFINKYDSDEKYQLDFESEQYMDVDDTPINVPLIFGNDPLLISILEEKIGSKLNRYIDERGNDKYIIANKFINQVTEPIDHIHTTSSISVMLSVLSWEEINDDTTKQFNANMIKYFLTNKKMTVEFYGKLFYYITDDNNKETIKRHIKYDSIKEFINYLYDFVDNHISHIYDIEPIEKLLKLVQNHIEENTKKGFKIADDKWYVEILLDLVQHNGSWGTNTFEMEASYLNYFIDYDKLSKEIKKEFA